MVINFRARNSKVSSWYAFLIFRNAQPPSHKNDRGEMTMAWQTPMYLHPCTRTYFRCYKINLHGKFGISNITKFNTALSATVLHHYYKLTDANANKISKGGHEYDGANQVCKHRKINQVCGFFVFYSRG